MLSNMLEAENQSIVVTASGRMLHRHVANAKGTSIRQKPSLKFDEF
jgi:hypothetical protein